MSALLRIAMGIAGAGHGPKRKGRMRKLAPSAAIALCVLGVSAVTFAKGNTALWANLSTLQPGETIQVVETDSKKVTGTFVNVSDTAISFDGASGEQTVQRDEVRSVKLLKNKHRLRHALIGAGVGAGGGAILGAATYTSCTGQPFCIEPGGRVTSAAMGAALGFVSGAVVGAVWPSNKTVYRAPSR